MLHVHDLVDYVSEEAAIAGRAAVKFIKGEKSKTVSVPLKADGKIRYTVPQIITEIKDTRVYFRVGDVFRDKKISVSVNGETLHSKKKQKLAPAEMETVELSADMIKRACELGGEIKLEIV